jgi:hypothetical protein
VVNLVAISQGNWYRARVGETSWTAATNTTGDSPPSIFTGVVQTAANNQKLYAADGTNWVRYDPLTNTVERWSATLGTLPVDQYNNKPRLICNWRSRIVLSGLLYAGQQLFMSAVDDPTNWLYLSDEPTPTQAFATTVGPQGSVGDIITALIPFTDDVLVLGTSSQIYAIQGDPQAGGQIGKLTESIGIAWGRAWCQSPEGTIFFLSNTCKVYAMVPGSVPQEISAQINPLLVGINTGTHGVRMAWEDRFSVLHVFVTKLSAPAATTHFVWEARTASWFTEEFANPNHNPLCCCTIDGNTADDRSVLMGGWDGYVRTFSADADDDDGTPIESEVLLGPVVTKTLDEVMFGDSVCVLGEESNPVNYAVLAADTAEAALAATPVKTGVWRAGRNSNTPISRAAHALYCRLSSDGTQGGWSFENLRVEVGTRGLVRGRGRG